MNKKKRFIIIILVAVAVVGVSIGVVSFLKKQNRGSKTVNVYSVNEVGYNYGINYEDMLYGNVTATHEQKVYISSNEQIDEIKVKEGDHVKVGDVLLVYDTTAQSLQLQTLATEVELARVAVLVAERELEELKNTKPVEDTPPTTVSPPVPEIPPVTEAPSTTEKPTEPATPGDATPGDAVVQQPTQPPVQQPVPPVQPSTTTEVVTPDNMLPDGEEVPEEETYTEEELKKAIKDKEAELSQLRISYQLMQISYSVMEYQNATGEVLCNCEGIVRTVNDQETAIANSEPIIVVGQADGFVVETQIGELSLANVGVGDTVTMMCYDDGMTYSGVITDISDIPIDGYYNGNAAESFYPMTVAVTDAENLSMGMYMEMTLDKEGTMMSDSLYLSSAFVVYENGGYYVYKDVDGILKKTPVSVGKISYGDMEILGGVTFEDYIAFPHSADIKEGVKTKQESVDKLY